MDGFDIAKAAAGYVISYYSDQQQAAALAAQVALALRDNNRTIITEVAKLLSAAFSQNKLENCINTVKTISLFMDEYNVNPSDQSKLIRVDQKSAELLDILDDSDIALAGISSWMIAANIRILALQEKSKYFSEDLTNAKNRAREYSEYITTMIPKVEQSIADRFSDVFFCRLPRPGDGLALNPCADGKYHYNLDGQVVMVRFDGDQATVIAGETPEEARDLREKHISELQKDPVDSMQQNVQKLLEFANR